MSGLINGTTLQMADFFGVVESTINKWELAHSEFLESIKRGKEIADMEIANSLFERARGTKKSRFRSLIRLQNKMNVG